MPVARTRTSLPSLTLCKIAAEFKAQGMRAIDHQKLPMHSALGREDWHLFDGRNELETLEKPKESASALVSLMVKHSSPAARPVTCDCDPL